MASFNPSPPPAAPTAPYLVAYKRFDPDDKAMLLALVNQHPVVLHGGTVELCELP